jgi:16S rRNA G966 N2-methylase RsmD
MNINKKDDSVEENLLLIKNYIAKLEKKVGGIKNFYWTKKDPFVAKCVIEEFAKENDSILDPFLGSGSSLYGMLSSKFQYKFYGVEINELPYQIVKFNLKEKNSKYYSRLEENFAQFKKEYEKLYIYELPNKDSFKINKIVITKLVPEIEVEEIFGTSQSNERVRLQRGHEFFSLIAEKYIERNKDHIDMVEQDLILDANSRIAVKDNMKISELFSPINFYILTKFRQMFRDDVDMNIILSSILHLVKYTDLKTQSQFPYWYPKSNLVDKNVISSFDKKLSEFKQAHTDQLSFFDYEQEVSNIPMGMPQKKLKNLNIKILNKPIQKILNSDIPDKSIDLIFTDPPYYDQVAYSEYLKLWEFFTGFKSNTEDEIVETNKKVSPKSRQDYLFLMNEAIALCSQKLKDNSFFIMYFKDSKIGRAHV